MTSQYFIRFTDTPERDLAQNYSLRNYLFGSTPEIAAYHALLSAGGWEGDEDEAIAEWMEDHAEEIVEVDGQYAVRLEGLCGFGPFETVEEAQAYIDTYEQRARYMAYSGLSSHIFVGQFIDWDENDEGVVFRAEALIR